MEATMTRFGFRVCLVGIAALLWTAAGGLTASATTPTVVWQATGVRTGYPNAVFSVDGTAILLTKSTGFELRRASDGVLLNTLTLPAASQPYDAAAFSPDKTMVGLNLFNNAVGTIEIWKLSTGTLQRTITTDAVRTMKGLDFSSAGLIASRERFAYGGGGFLRVYRVSDGSLVTKRGPVARNSAPGGAVFSPNAQLLALNDTFSLLGLWALRTSDWSSARSIVGSYIFSWVSDSASLWTDSFQQVRISDGAILKSVTLDGSTGVTAVTPDNRFLFAYTFVNGTASNTIKFVRTSDGGTQLTYTLPTGTVVWSNGVNSTQTLFTYEICPSDCTVYVARMPAL
jgi:hypothetical protein